MSEDDKKNYDEDINVFDVDDVDDIICVKYIDDTMKSIIDIEECKGPLCPKMHECNASELCTCYDNCHECPDNCACICTCIGKKRVLLHLRLL